MDEATNPSDTATPSDAKPKKKGKTGRPRMPDGQRRDVLLSFAVTSADRDEILALAESMGLTASTLIRRSVFATMARLKDGRAT